MFEEAHASFMWLCPCLFYVIVYSFLFGLDKQSLIQMFTFAKTMPICLTLGDI